MAEPTVPSCARPGAHALAPQHRRRTACAATALLALGAAGAAQQPADLARAFAPHDVDGDGRAELRRLDVLAEHGAAAARLVVVVVERRLLDGPPPAAPGGAAPALRRALDLHTRQLANEGWRVLLVAVDVHSGPPHQDGRTVLALRRLFQRLHAAAPMGGAVLVGHFPDALLVRTCNWRRNEPLSLPGPDGQPVAIDAATTNVRCVPEIVAHRCDLVLADLDGDWEACYVPGPARLPATTVVFADGARSADGARAANGATDGARAATGATDGARAGDGATDRVPPAGGAARALQTGHLDVVDVFHVRDGRADVDAAAFAVRLDAADRDRECTAADRALGNPLARPELAISRIDARGVAWLPPAAALATAPDGALRPVACAAPGPGGGAATATAAAVAAAPQPLAWTHDLELERQLLAAWLERNVAFRTRASPTSSTGTTGSAGTPGATGGDDTTDTASATGTAGTTGATSAAVAHAPAAFGHDLPAGMASLRAADPAWRDFARDGHEVQQGDLPALAEWWLRPALLRTLRAHSDPHGAQVGATPTTPARLAELLGAPWQWQRDGERFVPTWAPHAHGRADFVFYRALAARERIAPHVLLHTGCEALSPPGAVAHAFDHPDYGLRAHAESLLFFTNCMALVGRAKVFYDEPRGFAEALGAGATVGEAWQRYFALESAAADWREVGDDIGRKRAYFWSIAGDWTVRLPRPR